MNHLLLISLILLSSSLYGYDQFDIMVCEAEGEREKIEECFLNLGIPINPKLREENIGVEVKKAKRFSKDQLMMGRNMEIYADRVIDMLEQLSKTHESCKKHLDPYTAGVSSTYGTTSNPSFFVQCGSKSTPEVVRFTLDDINNQRLPTAAKNISQSLAIRKCREAAKEEAAIPSSVDFSVFLDLNFNAIANGNSVLSSSFNAKNMFGMATKYHIICRFQGDQLTETTVKALH